MRVMRPLWALPLVAPMISLSLCSFAVAQDEQIQDAVDNLVKSVNASVARDVAQANKTADEARKNAGATSGDNVMIVTCTDEDGQPQNVEVRGLMKNTVIVNCQTDEDGQPHIVVKGDGATREIGTVKVEGGAENAVIVNDHRFRSGTNIIVDGKNAKASVGTVEVRGGQVKNSTIINNAVINGGTVKATGEGATATAGGIIVQ